MVAICDDAHNRFSYHVLCTGRVLVARGWREQYQHVHGFVQVSGSSSTDTSGRVDLGMFLH